MAYKFHTSKHGTAVIVTRDGRSVMKPDASKVTNSVALTSEPLRVGEAFEVIIDASLPIDHGGLEIGVTTNNPADLTIPKTMTDLHIGATYMSSQGHIARNQHGIMRVPREGRPQSFEVGDVIGVKLNSLGCIQFLRNKKCLCSVELQEDCPVYGVVDLYGKPQQVTIYSGQAINPQVRIPSADCIMIPGLGQQHENDIEAAPVEDIKESITIILQMMKLKSPDDIDIVHSILEGLKVSAMTSLDKRAEIAVELITQNAPQIFTDYVQFLQLVEKVRLHFDVLSFIWHTCEHSMEFNIAIGKTGLFQMCVEDVKRVEDIPMSYQRILIATLDVVCKASAAAENVALLRHLGYVQAAKVCTNGRYKPQFVVSAIMSIAFVMEDSEADVIRLDYRMCGRMLNWFQEAISDDNHKFHHWHVLDFCRCFTKLAGCFQNLKEVVSGGGHVLFARLLKNGNSEEQEKAAQALLAHTCPQSFQIISKVPRMLDLLGDVQPSWTEATKTLCADILSQLQDYVDKHGNRTSMMERDSVMERREIDVDSRSAKVLSSVMENPKFPAYVSPKKDIHEELADMSVRDAAAAERECSYMENCRQFVSSLALQDAYFSHHHDRCFCVECHTPRGVDDYSERGSPKQKYALPIGWARFGLSVPPKTKALKVHAKWHKAFHGTKQRNLAKILEIGELAVPGHVVLGGEHIFERSIHVDGNLRTDGKKIFVSPSIRYAGGDAYAPAELYISESGERYFVRVAFEIFIAPRSYKAGKQTIGLTEEIDPGFRNDEIEWTTSQQGSNILYGLLVKLDKACLEE